MPLSPSVGSLNATGWSRPQVHAVGRADRRAQLGAGLVHRPRDDHRPRLDHVGRRDVVPPRAVRVAEELGDDQPRLARADVVARQRAELVIEDVALDAVLPAHVRRAADALDVAGAVPRVDPVADERAIRRRRGHAARTRDR